MDTQEKLAYRDFVETEILNLGNRKHSSDEISQALGIPTSVVRSILHQLGKL